MENKKLQLTEKELEIFGNDFLDEFEMMETYAGGEDIKGSCPVTNTDCGCIKFFCSDECIFKAWFRCKGNCTA